MLINSLDRFAAYASARNAQSSILRATSAWPRELANEAAEMASNLLKNTAQAAEQEPTSPDRRKSLRHAICHALELAALCDIASKHGLTSDDLDDSLRHASRTISMLGMSFHATATADD